MVCLVMLVVGIIFHVDHLVKCIPWNPSVSSIEGPIHGLSGDVNLRSSPVSVTEGSISHGLLGDVFVRIHLLPLLAVSFYDLPGGMSC